MISATKRICRALCFGAGARLRLHVYFDLHNCHYFQSQKIQFVLFSLSVRLKTVSQLLTRQDKVYSRRSTILCLTWMKAWCASTERRLIHKTRREPLSLLSTSPRLLSRYVHYSFDVYSTPLLSSRSPSITPQRALNWPRRTVVSAMHKSEFFSHFQSRDLMYSFSFIRRLTTVVHLCLRSHLWWTRLTMQQMRVFQKYNKLTTTQNSFCKMWSRLKVKSVLNFMFHALLLDSVFLVCPSSFA